MSNETGKGYVMALGFFDGVHKGHAELIKMAKFRARELNASPAVLSFDTSPESVITGRSVPLIGSAKTRADTIRRVHGVENVIFYHFDREVMAMPWKVFLQSLVDDYSVIHLVIGHDFHCGYKGEGSPERILAYCGELGIGCDVIEKFTLDGVTVSSTYIKNLIAEGNIERANYFLGHPYVFSGTVREGFKVGRGLGAPTINLSCSGDLVLPAKGVYATEVLLQGEGDEGGKPAVTNVGIRPTFGDSDEISMESFILDFDNDLYGEFVSVKFHKFLRPERKFENPKELSEQIARDIKAAKAYWDGG